MSLPRIVLGAVALVVIGVGLAAAGWWFFIREDNELATNSPAITDALKTSIAAGTTPAASTTAATQTGSTPAATGGALAFKILPDQSDASYFADEQLASLPLPSTAKGTTKEIEGTFYLTADGFELDSSQQSTFTVQLANLKSDRDMRDNRVRQTLDVTQFPSATFVAKSVSGVDTTLAADQEHSFQLTGDLTVHGVTKAVTWDVKARRDGNLMTGLATVNFLYSDFGMSAPNIANFVAVEDDVTIQVEIVAQAG